MTDTPTSKLLHIMRGVEVYENFEPNGTRVWYVAGLEVDADGAPKSYRLDNDFDLALDDIHESAGWPHADWWNVLARDPNNENRPYVDDQGYCVSMTSYQKNGFNEIDRRRYLDASSVPYAVIPSVIRNLVTGKMLGCKSRITRMDNGAFSDCVCGDVSGYSIGEASLFVAQKFDEDLSPFNGDERKIYLFEFWPGIAANGFTLQ